MRTSDLDPDTQFEQIVRHLTTTDFPWDIRKSLEFALYRTYAVPEISSLLAVTGKFERAPQRRYDDTQLLLAFPVENGLDSKVGCEAIQRINDIHANYSIRNELYLYVLSTFIFEPIRWMEKYGRRPFVMEEKKAWFLYYRQFGERLNILDIPRSITEFELYNRDFESRYFRYKPSNKLIAAKTRDLLLGFYLPKKLVPYFRPVVYSLLDETLLKAFDFPSPHSFLKALVRSGLLLRRKIVRLLPRRTRPVSLTKKKRPSYPMDFAISDLGH